MASGDAEGSAIGEHPSGTVAAFFSTREKFRRALWYLVAGTLFRIPIRRADGWRVFLLRCFGARVGRGCLIRRTAWIELPWNLTLGDGVMLGEHCIIYNLGPMIIGDRAMVSQYAHLCGGSHDHSTREMMLLRVPVRIGADAWIAADAFIGPGVTVGEGTIVGARSSVFRDVPAWKICHGSPARVVRDRVLSDRTKAE
ncbi:MAG: colanic acid biosynthesis acetyltransferase WcaF [Tepidisphaera sp.]|nr:colanic acid biosynthesis acetyltransferase WcaF [Tepidisphaera sp.]